jgi:transcriptional regulator with XRE-family HTH domain
MSEMRYTVIIGKEAIPLAANQLGKNIQRLLSERGMKPIELSETARVNRGQLSRVLQGRASLSIPSLERIAAVLGVAPGTLLEGETHKVRDLSAELEREPTLAVALRSLRQLDESDRAQVITIIERFAASAKPT